MRIREVIDEYGDLVSEIGSQVPSQQIRRIVHFLRSLEDFATVDFSDRRPTGKCRMTVHLETTAASAASLAVVLHIGSPAPILEYMFRKGANLEQHA